MIDQIGSQDTQYILDKYQEVYGDSAEFRLKKDLLQKAIKQGNLQSVEEL